MVGEMVGFNSVPLQMRRLIAVWHRGKTNMPNESQAISGRSIKQSPISGHPSSQQHSARRFMQHSFIVRLVLPTSLLPYRMHITCLVKCTW